MRSRFITSSSRPWSPLGSKSNPQGIHITSSVQDGLFSHTMKTELTPTSFKLSFIKTRFIRVCCVSTGADNLKVQKCYEFFKSCINIKKCSYFPCLDVKKDANSHIHRYLEISMFQFIAIHFL